jgi:hypothetical protein
MIQRFNAWITYRSFFIDDANETDADEINDWTNNVDDEEMLSRVNCWIIRIETSFAVNYASTFSADEFSIASDKNEWLRIEIDNHLSSSSLKFKT